MLHKHGTHLEDSNHPSAPRAPTPSLPQTAEERAGERRRSRNTAHPSARDWKSILATAIAVLSHNLIPELEIYSENHYIASCRMIRYLAALLCAIGILAMIFGYWGVNTVAGRRRFDEMAGIIPFSIGVAGAVVLLIGIVWLVIRLRS